MPGSALAEFILKPILEFVFEIAFEIGCYWTGRVVVPIATLGQVHCEPLCSDDANNSREYTPLWREKLSYREEGRLILSITATQLVGLATILLIAGVLIAVAVISN